MSQAAALKLNMLYMPLAYTGKYNDAFRRKDGKRFNAATQAIAADIRTQYRLFQTRAAKCSCQSLSDTLNLSRPTICVSLKTLVNAGIIERAGQSEYVLKEIEERLNYIRIPLYFLTGTFNGRKLTRNAVYALCLILREICNPDTVNIERQYFSVKGKRTVFFIGGESQISKAINVSTSTASRIVKLLTDAKLVHTHCVHKVDGNWIVEPGKGYNSKYVTALSVDRKTLLQYKKDTATDNETRGELEAALKLLYSDNTPAATSTATEPEEPGKYSKYALNLLSKEFAGNAEFKRFKTEYKGVNALVVSSVLKGDDRQAESLEQKLNKIKKDLLNFILAHNVQRKNLPAGDALDTLLHGLLIE